MTGDGRATGLCEVCGKGINVASYDDVVMLGREIGLNVNVGASFSVGAFPGPYRRACARCYVAEMRACR